ncbi:disease resistance protein Pik-2-like [Triticum dicoccoides]|uniref:disease resistance protein Pik-2-like n=1 Tax=Triticum dicoccoides TaxID=85692 RepID=UPI00188E161B|nr:disease resistance protein Pik-2-like [Triticum dicoccoides]
MEAATQLVSIVGQFVGEEYQQLRGVGGQVAELSDELDTMNAILRMLSDAEEGAVDHFIRVWMKQVRELAYDAEDCVHLYILRIRCRPRDRFLVWSKRVLATLFPRRRLAREIQELRARAVVISERHARYGVSREALLRCTTSSIAAPTPVLRHAFGRPAANDPDHLVGITEQADKLSNMVRAVGDKNLKVFSIVGFGGLGKTTLAIEVCRKLEVEFPHQAQVSVSQAFGGTKDLEGLLRRILRQIVQAKAENAQGIKEENPLHGVDDKDESDLTRMLKELLKDKRYLIVVDDIWTVATWDTIRPKLPDNKNGSRVIVTTRIESVAEACGDASVDGDRIYQMKPLDFNDSKKLFLSRAFGSENDTLHNDLRGEMDKILRKCGGLPMAIISIANLLASYKSPESKDMWERICKSIGSQMENHPTLEGMRKIVTLSYNHLHYYLKGCIMYLSIFPEDYVITKKRLLKRWIAEGLVAEIRGLTLMEAAEAYYNELLSRNMIVRAGDIVSWWDGTVETCQVHDMVLEVMVSKSLEANFVSLVGGSYEGMSYGSIRRLSIHGGEVVSEGSCSTEIATSHGRKNDIEGMKMEHVRSLSMFGPKDNMKMLDRLGELSLLRVLDLEDCTAIKNKHLRHVCRMYLLKFLNLKGTSISEMPPEVGDLENLETLDVRQTHLEDLPETVTKLEKLEHLQFNKKDAIFYTSWRASKGLGRMKALQTVNAVVFGSDADVAEELVNLQQVRELRMDVDCGPLDLNVRKNLAVSLGKIYSLRWLNITDHPWVNRTDPLGDPQYLDFIHEIDPPPRLLGYLRIGSGISKLPDWVGSLNYLTELFLSWTYLVGDQLFGPVCKLPNLLGIHLEAYYYVAPELVAQTTHNFPALKNLCLNFDIHFMEVLRFEEKSMSKLEKLQVRFLDKDTKILEGMDNLTSLKEVVLEGNRDNPALHRAVQQLKTMNEKRQKSDQIKVAVKYGAVQWPSA